MKITLKRIIVILVKKKNQILERGKSEKYSNLFLYACTCAWRKGAGRCSFISPLLEKEGRVTEKECCLMVKNQLEEVSE